MVQGEGIIRYRSDAVFQRLIVEIDPGITEFYRSLVPKAVRLNRQKYAPHITVLREEVLPNPAAWGLHEGELIVFNYNPIIRVDDVYYWLDVYSTRLEGLREELGLPRMGPGARPPDEKECFHTTLGNLGKC